MPDPLPLQSARVCNFKAIRDSGTIEFTPLTAFIGNNGAGKSSLIEALEMMQQIAMGTLNETMHAWGGFESVWNQASPHSATAGSSYGANPMHFEMSGRGYSTEADGSLRKCPVRAQTEITTDTEIGNLLFLREELCHELPELPGEIRGEWTIKRTPDKTTEQLSERPSILFPLFMMEGRSILALMRSLFEWQFLRLNPVAMAAPKQSRSMPGLYPLEKDGSNIAEYLRQFPRDQGGKDALRGIVETLQAIVPYAADLAPMRSSPSGEADYLQLTEREFHLPGWVLSTGTLRLVALLALFRHPEPPPLIVIEEIENGLDPRAIGMIVEEIRELVRSGRSQVILTTHSPYLLDLLPLESLILVERTDGEPTFRRPADDESVQRWSQDFAPGRLHTMGRLHSRQ